MVRRAFTLIELLVVIAIIAVLIAILVPTMGMIHETSLRTQCAANLKGQGQAFAVFATGAADKLPVFVPGDTASSHLNEQSSELTATLLGAPSAASTVGVKWFFCPSNTTAKPATLGTLLGYAYLTARSATNDLTNAGVGSPLPSIPANLRVAPPLTYHDRWVGTPNASMSELALDLIVNNNGMSDFSAAVPNVGTTSHMKTDIYPAGANVLCFDGHVSFQKFAGPVAPAPNTPDVPLNRAALRMNDGSIFYFPAP